MIGTFKQCMMGSAALTSPSYPASVDDDFSGVDGSPPNEVLWDITGISADCTCQIHSNKLRTSIPVSSVDKWVELTSNFTINGDYDFSFDFNEISYTSPSSSVSYLTRCDVISGALRAGFALITKGVGNHAYVSMDSDGGWYEYNTSVTSGVIRLRKGGDWFHTYLNGVEKRSWQPSIAYTSNVKVRFQFNGDYDSGLVTDIDNFALTQGTITWE